MLNKQVYIYYSTAKLYSSIIRQIIKSSPGANLNCKDKIKKLNLNCQKKTANERQSLN